MAKQAVVATSDYGVDQIELHLGAKGIRARPGMYVGDLDDRGVTHLFFEVFGNSGDEATNGFGKTIRCYFGADGSVTVGDEGRGIPVGLHPKDKEKRDTLTILCTEMHTGGKFEAGATNYKKGKIGCFVGSTKIKLLNGQSVRIDDLADDFKKTGQKRWVYAFNKESGLSFVPRKAYGAFATRMATELTEVVLSNGKRILCTPDHPFMLWTGEYVAAQDLKASTSLRAVHFAYDKDGYLTHSGPKRLRKRPVKAHLHRVQRTVAKAMGWDIEGKDVAHKNANKVDNRPENLVPMERGEHWWHDHDKHQKNADWSLKDEVSKERSKSTMERLNQTVDDIQEKAQLGRYAQIAARAYRDYGVVNEGTYNACVPWCGPRFDKAVIALGNVRNLLRAGKAYLNTYGDEGRTDNGGLGLNYKLQSEYERSPSVNYNNHSVVSVRTFKTKKPVQVYGLSVEEDHNYLLDAGVFVKNTHGVGLGVVNALSSKLEVWSWRNRCWNFQSFTAGEPDFPNPKVVKALPADLGFEQPRAGTVLRFKPDLKCFNKGAKFSAKLALEWLDEVSWLIGDVRVEVTLEGKKTKVFHRPNGLQDRFAFECERFGVEPIHEPFIYHSDNIDCLIGWTNSTEEVTYSSVSAIRTREGGTHVKGLEAAITASFAAYADKKAAYKNDTLRIGMIAIINIRMNEPSFNSQDKVMLKSPEAKELVMGELYADETKAAFWSWLGERGNKPLREAVFAKAEEFTRLNEGFKASKKLAAEYAVEKRGKVLLPKSLMRCTTDNPEDVELYIVEGTSAGGIADKARNSVSQEVFLLSGKILNVHKADVEQAMYSERIKELMQCIGYNPATPGKYRVGKTILLTDADDDGSHIAALILGLFHKVVPDFVQAGRVFVADAPLYVYKLNKGNVYGADLKELEERVAAASANTTFDPKFVTRIKGWGEVNPATLKEIAFATDSRKLTRVMPPVTAKEKQMVIDLMGEEVAARRRLLGV